VASKSCFAFMMNAFHNIQDAGIDLFHSLHLSPLLPA
jgi:hypothetical protein